MRASSLDGNRPVVGVVVAAAAAPLVLAVLAPIGARADQRQPHLDDR